MNSVLQGLILGLVLFNIFISNVDSGVEQTLSRFANDTKVSDAVSAMEGRDATQKGWRGLKVRPVQTSRR